MIKLVQVINFIGIGCLGFALVDSVIKRGNFVRDVVPAIHGIFRGVVDMNDTTENGEGV